MSSWKATQAAFLEMLCEYCESLVSAMQRTGATKAGVALEGIPLAREPVGQFSETHILTSINKWKSGTP
jgi:hypothetical protein